VPHAANAAVNKTVVAKPKIFFIFISSHILHF